MFHIDYYIFREIKKKKKISGQNIFKLSNQSGFNFELNPERNVSHWAELSRTTK